MNTEELIETININNMPCFVSLNIGVDLPFYEKRCVEEGNFAWSNFQLGYTVFVNPIELYEENSNRKVLFNFV